MLFAKIFVKTLAIFVLNSVSILAQDLEGVRHDLGHVGHLGHGHGAMAMAAGATGGLAILVDEKRVNELLQQKSGIKALLRCHSKSCATHVQVTCKSCDME